MPIVGRKTIQSNIVASPPTLPVEMLNGSMSWSQTWNGEMPLKNGKPADKARAEPVHQATLEYRSVDEDTKSRIKGAYPVESRVSFGGFSFEVGRVSIVRESVSQGESDRIHLYNVSISLSKYLSPKERRGEYSGNGSSGSISLAPGISSGSDSSALEFSSSAFGSSGFFNNWEVLSDGGSSESVPSVGYNDAEIKFSPDSVNPSNFEINRPAEWEAVPPVIEVAEEFSENYMEPPENTSVLRDGTDLYVNSGQTKMYQKSTTVDGQPYLDHSELWAFTYTYEDIHAGDGVLYSSKPNLFWKKVEEKDTTHIYRQTGGLTYQARVVVPSGEESAFDKARSLQPIVDPTYDALIKVTPQGIKFKSRAYYATESVTTGYTVNQYVRETESRNTLYDEDPYYPLFQFEKIPLVQRKVRLLKPVRSIEGEEVPTPFSANFVPYEELSLKMRTRAGARSTTPDGTVAVLSVDPDFVEPMYIAVEGEGLNSFAWKEDPEAEIDPDKKIPGTDIPLPRLRLITGQETRNETSRKLLANGRYQERISTYSSQNPGHDNMAEQVRIRRMKGTPPAATSRVQRRKLKKTERTVRGDDPAEQTRVFITTPGRSKRFPKGGSVSVNSATTISEAIAEIKLKLRQSEMQRTQSSLTLAWHHPGIRCKQNLSTDKDQNSAKKVMKVAWSLDFQSDGLGGVVCTSSGTSVTRGDDGFVAISTRKEKVKPEAPGEQGNNPTAEFSVLGGSGAIGNVLPPIQTRRNY